MNKIKRTICGTIEAMSYGGRGVLKAEGKVFFISGGLPGDHIEAAITKEKKTWGEGRIAKLLKQAAYRQNPPCQYHGVCGGCQWQAAPYSQQIDWKRQFIATAFEKIAKVHAPVDSFVPSSDEFFYRNRTTLRLGSNHKKLEFAFLQEKSHERCTIEICRISDPLINSAITDLTGSRISFLAPQELAIEFQALWEDKLIATIRPTRKAHSKDIKALRILLESTSRVVAVEIQGRTVEKFFVYDQQFGLDYYTSHDQFQQVNLPGNRLLREEIKSLIDALKPTTIVDLFCGSGNLSLHLAAPYRTIIGVEANSRSIAAANYNVKANRLSGFSYLNQTSKEFLANRSREQDQIDVLIVDPPRGGIENAIDDVIAMESPAIIYVSCDPNTLARDCLRLVESGYKIERLTGMDFFPHTYHVETLAVLTKHPT